MIVPRWEWRTFGDDLGTADDRLNDLAPTRIDDSDELYIVSNRNEGSIKIRGGVLDVKRLEQVNDDGLEQWRPVAKAEFPISATDIAALLAALDVEAPPLPRAAYELDELVEEVVGRSPDLLAVPVHKRRAHYLLGDCMAELTELRADAQRIWTIALEFEDPAVVRAAVEELGLWSRPNVSFPRGLKALVGFGTRRYGVVDVGTNSVKFHLAERAADGTWHQLVDRAEVTRLGEGVQETGRLQDAPVERTVAAIAEMTDEGGRLEVDAIVAVGTAGLRAAGNSAEFIAIVEERSGVRVEVISGEEEARLAFLAATSAFEGADGALVVFETGGGSTQFTFGDGVAIEEQFSVPVGAVRFTEQFGLDQAVDDATLAAALAAIADDFGPLAGRPTPAALLGMGGAVTNLAAVKHGLAEYDSDVVHGSLLTRDELDGLIELFRTRSADERRGIVGLQPKRAEVILAGACIVRTVLELLGRESLTVSDRGLRHRLLVERFGV